IMATPRNLFTVLVPPLLMAVLLFLPKLVLTLSAPQLALAVLFLVFFCFVFFWGCVWLSGAIGRLLTITRPWPLMVVNIMIQFLLTASASSPVDLAMHNFTWSRVFRDSFEQTGAFLVAYLAYLTLRRVPPSGAPQPALNNRQRGP